METSLSKEQETIIMHMTLERETVVLSTTIRITHFVEKSVFGTHFYHKPATPVAALMDATTSTVPLPGKCQLTQVPPDSAAPQGKRRDF